MGEVRKCVSCRTHAVDARWRPFCSERCRNEDLAQWAGGHYRIAADPVDPLESDDADQD